MERSLWHHDTTLAPGDASLPVKRAVTLEPRHGSTVLGLVCALGIHATVYALAPQRAAMSAVPAPDEVAIELFEPPPPAPELPPEPEEPALAVMAPEPKERVVQPVRKPSRAEPPARPEPPKPAEAAPPPQEPEPVAEPAPPVEQELNEPAPALVADADAPSSHEVRQGGGTGGTGQGGSPNGVPGGKGPAVAATGQGVKNGTGTGSAQPVTLSMKNWRCAWPSEAEYEDFDEQLVAIRVVVAEDGRVEKAEVLSDPGYGFGRAARDCARRVRFNPAKDAFGRAIKAQSPPIHVKFVR